MFKAHKQLARVSVQCFGAQKEAQSADRLVLGQQWVEPHTWEGCVGGDRYCARWVGVLGRVEGEGGGTVGVL